MLPSQRAVLTCFPAPYPPVAVTCIILVFVIVLVLHGYPPALAAGVVIAVLAAARGEIPKDLPAAAG